MKQTNTGSKNEEGLCDLAHEALAQRPSSLAQQSWSASYKYVCAYFCVCNAARAVKHLSSGGAVRWLELNEFRAREARARSERSAPAWRGVACCRGVARRGASVQLSHGVQFSPSDHSSTTEQLRRTKRHPKLETLEPHGMYQACPRDSVPG